jgi:hypothetical protein
MRSHAQRVSDEISAEILLSPRIDGALAVHRAITLFLSILEDHKPGAFNMFMRVLEHVCRRMDEIERHRLAP